MECPFPFLSVGQVQAGRGVSKVQSSREKKKLRPTEANYWVKSVLVRNWLAKAVVALLLKGTAAQQL